MFDFICTYIQTYIYTFGLCALYSFGIGKIPADVLTAQCFVVVVCSKGPFVHQSKRKRCYLLAAIARACIEYD